ncbi:general transcription factor 3C polypeptide 5 isoform X1 [Neophocaena asiaeorientalis asiaeorientalis]|uniref:General transcription factor 3C polypeptide 5 n=2 Tax=Phocoenidae TaxID=9740 RepID=A0A341CU11_NEOAA|nr:general transcription factor 3C polypeptide 5 isoform X1 [Neophocaena asiaeorientalis asiaeorientalis]XP_032490966.1 general transcription factor 3C polypeptide 5 isoform X1 [Phocoena sinus]
MAAADWGSGVAVPVELRRERHIVCVEYPGVVRDVSKMLQTLGGEEGVSRIYADPTKRLELYFRPKDPYCHPVCANRFSASSLLLRIKRKMRRQRGAPGPEAPPKVTFDIESLGIVSTVYKFQGMSDFQYLAVHTEAGGRHMSMYSKVLMVKPEKENFFHQELPLYIPPPIFSRLDTPVDYSYRPETQHREGYNNPSISGENLIGLSRARRPHNAIFVNFEGDEVPEQPLEAAAQTWRKVCTNPVDHKVEEELRKLFEIRPIWSRNAVKANISVHPDKLKVLLPFMAYYMITGPWRSLWIRFGYDPRKHPDAKIYQVLDFRIRCGMKYGYAPSDMPVKAKRSTYNYSLPITVKKTSSQLVTMQDLKQGLGPSGSASARKLASNKYKLKDSVYIFREGALPPYRQMFYQFCDLNVDELQEIIHRNDGAESLCTERDGWCLPKTSDDLRDVMSLMIRHTIRSKRPDRPPGAEGLWLRPATAGVGAPRSQRRDTHGLSFGPALFSSPAKADDGKEQLTCGSGDEDAEDAEDEDDEDDEDDFKPSDGSENEMETEILDYV